MESCWYVSFFILFTQTESSVCPRYTTKRKNSIQKRSAARKVRIICTADILFFKSIPERQEMINAGLALQLNVRRYSPSLREICWSMYRSCASLAPIGYPHNRPRIRTQAPVGESPKNVFQKKADGFRSFRIFPVFNNAYSGKSFFWVKKQKKQQADIEKYDYFSFHKNRSLLFLQYMIIIKDK